MQGEDPYAAVSENITNDSGDEDDMEGISEKKIKEDCPLCLCFTCANIEKCIEKPDDGRGGALPYPCYECVAGGVYVSVEEKCAGYVTGAENYG